MAWRFVVTDTMTAPFVSNKPGYVRCAKLKTVLRNTAYCFDRFFPLQPIHLSSKILDRQHVAPQPCLRIFEPLPSLTSIVLKR
jgi:hypothetical protein